MRHQRALCKQQRGITARKISPGKRKPGTHGTCRREALKISESPYPLVDVLLYRFARADWKLP